MSGRFFFQEWKGKPEGPLLLKCFANNGTSLIKRNLFVWWKEITKRIKRV
jgi:hypothetical protein